MVLRPVTRYTLPWWELEMVLRPVTRYSLLWWELEMVLRPVTRYTLLLWKGPKTSNIVCVAMVGAR